MVTISNFFARKREDGTTFFILEITSGIEMIKSKTTGMYYATTKKCNIPTTLKESQCLSLRGTTMPGSIKRVDCEPYEFIQKKTGELLTLNYRFEYVPEVAEVQELETV